MSNVVLFPQLKPSHPAEVLMSVRDYEKAMATLERGAEHMRDHMVAVTAYLEDLRSHLEAHRGAAGPRPQR